MHSADYAVARCPSVHLSVTMAQHIIKLCSPPSSHTPLVFEVPNVMRLFLCIFYWCRHLRASVRLAPKQKRNRACSYM